MSPLFFILGPCVLEDEEMPLRVAEQLAEIAARLHIPVFFKSSFDKANRTRLDAFRGPGLDAGLRILESVKASTGLPVLTDIHLPQQAAAVAEVVDVIQIPAFLCRQTDLLVAAAATGKPIHVKKGQFLAPRAMAHVAHKLQESGATEIWLCERGTCLGYGDLVVDMRGLPTLRNIAQTLPGGRVVFDATHSVQRPGGAPDGATGGQRELVPVLARAAVAAGVDGVFAEVHPHPEDALCDASNQWPLECLEPLLRTLLAIHEAVAPG